MANCEPKSFKCSDGNGGHIWDWAKIKEGVIAGLILAIIIAALTTASNRIFNVRQLEEGLVRIERYQRESKQMNLMQNERINSNTSIVYGQFFPKYPRPIDLYWPEEK